MEIKHAVGLFKTQNNSITLEKYYDEQESLDISKSLSVNPQELNSAFSELLLFELKKPEYKEKIIQANMEFVQRQIAQSVNTDTFIIQAVNSISELDKICNTMTKRLREWYGYYYPELGVEISDNEMFVKKIVEHSKSELMAEYDHKISMGPEILEKDLDEMLIFAKRTSELFDERSRLVLYLDNTLMNYCPNVYTLTGAVIGAKLIEKAGSLKHLSQMPSSTIQLLGAEKALFRHLRNKNIRSPKHGLILSHSILMNAPRNMKGTAARMFAAKISIASKVDYFKGEFIGDKLLEDLKKKLGQ